MCVAKSHEMQCSLPPCWCVPALCGCRCGSFSIKNNFAKKKSTDQRHDANGFFTVLPAPGARGGAPLMVDLDMHLLFLSFDELSGKNTKHPASCDAHVTYRYTAQSGGVPSITTCISSKLVASYRKYTTVRLDCDTTGYTVHAPLQKAVRYRLMFIGPLTPYNVCNATAFSLDIARV